MSQKRRYAGFVVGCDNVGNGKKVWKVRVNDGSDQNQKKFEVATKKAELTKGLEVEFDIGSVLIGKVRVLKAIEVDPIKVREGVSK